MSTVMEETRYRKQSRIVVRNIKKIGEIDYAGIIL